MALVLTGDLHLDQKMFPYNSNVRTKERDLEEAAAQIGEYATEENELIIEGDVFDNNKPKPEAVTFLRYLYDKYWQGFAKIIILLGNHDASDTSDDALHLIETWKIPNIKVIRDIKGITLSGVKLFCLPHLSKQVLQLKINQDYDEAVTREVSKYLKHIQKADLVVGHGTLKGAKVGSERFSIKKAISLPSLGTRAILGHVHKPQDNYVGSPTYVDFAEINDVKRFLVIKKVNSKLQSKSVTIKNLQQYKEVVLDGTKTEKIKVPQTVLGNYIYKIVIKTTKELRYKINQVKLKHVFNECGYVQQMVCDVKKDKETVKKEERALASVDAFTPKSALKNWLRKNVNDKTRRQRLYNKGGSILDAA